MTNIFTFEIGLILPLSRFPSIKTALSLSLSLLFLFAPRKKQSIPLIDLHHFTTCSLDRTYVKKKKSRRINRTIHATRPPSSSARENPTTAHASEYTQGTRVPALASRPSCHPRRVSAYPRVCVCTYLLPTRWWSKGVAGRMPGDRR